MYQLSGTTVAGWATSWVSCPFCASWRRDWDNDEDAVYDDWPRQR